MSGKLMDVAEISRMLAYRVDDLCAQLLPLGRREGHEWVEAKRAAGGIGDSLRVHLRAPRAGVWKHFSAGVGGDALDLVAYVKFGGDKKAAVAWAKGWLGLDQMDPALVKKERRLAADRARQADQDAAKNAARKARIAQALWLNGQRELTGTPVDLYLRGRGVDLAAMAKAPGSLRYVSRLAYPPHLNGGKETAWPAMAAQICDGDGNFIAVHRTYLHSPQPGVVVKAPVVDAKLTLGSYRGGFITLARGISGKSLRDAPAGDRLILCEGIEDGLTLAQACPDYRVMAAISVGNFRHIKLPPGIGTVVIAADNDPPTIVDGGVEKPHPARVALQAAIDAFIDQGRRVMVARAPEGKDFNDMVRDQEGVVLAQEVRP